MYAFVRFRWRQLGTLSEHLPVETKQKMLIRKPYESGIKIAYLKMIGKYWEQKCARAKWLALCRGMFCFATDNKALTINRVGHLRDVLNMQTLSFCARQAEHPVLRLKPKRNEQSTPI